MTHAVKWTYLPTNPKPKILNISSKSKNTMDPLLVEDSRLHEKYTRLPESAK